MSTQVEEVKEEKSEDKKDIEMEEREKMLNEENKTQDKVTPETPEEKKKEVKEGMEVKPKKIPIGGIQMPGFFTRSKSKEKCKEEGEQTEVEGTELINKDKEEPQAQTRIKLPNPFRKSKTQDEEGDKEESKEKKSKLLGSIKIPLVSMLPRKKKDQGQSLENQAQAGLASMETLDDKSTEEKSGEELKNVTLEEKEKETEKKDKDVEKQEEQAEETSWKQKIIANKIAIGALLLFLILVIIIVAIAVPGREIQRTPPVKDGKYIETVTACGPVEGMIEDSAVAFRGIPYARPPIGDLRFRFAQPLNSLDYCWNGTFLAHNASETCLQINSDGSIEGVEDCLTLDVITPYVRYENPLPVIVLIGAESLMGGSPGKMRPSARYARSKDVVFVRPNFRLGALGFLALEELSKSEYPNHSGNYGLSDILEALKWVQLNIQHFGGDPTSVTLFGHRAGATLVTALATTSKAKKYFSRAWATSGGAIYPKKSRIESESDKSFPEAVNCKDAACLRSLDAVKLVTAVQDTWRKPQPDLPSKTEEPEKRHEWLVLDGVILKEHPAEVWAKEEDLPVQLVIGTTAHSGSSEKLYNLHVNWTEELVKSHINNSVLADKGLVEEALKSYPASYKGLSAMISDIRTVCPLVAITSQMRNVPFYVVTQTRSERDLADIDSDVDAILGRYEPKTPEQRRYVSAMQGLFYHYVYHGKIEQAHTLGQKILVIGQDVLPNATYSECAFWINNNIVLPYAALD